MTKVFILFLRREDGAVTVDWVILSAAVIGMVMVVLIPVALSTTSATVGISEYISETPVGYKSQ